MNDLIFTYQNPNNEIIYNINNSVAIGKFLKAQQDMNLNQAKTMLKNFLDHITNNYSQCDYFLNVPGTKNPYLAKAIIETAIAYNKTYRLFFGKNEIFDAASFVVSNIDPVLSNINNFSCRVEVCDRLPDSIIVSQSLKDNFIPKSPFKYYEYDSNGFIFAEYDEKPNNISNIYISDNLSDRYQTHTIQYINNKTLIFRLK